MKLFYLFDNPDQETNTYFLPDKKLFGQTTFDDEKPIKFFGKVLFVLLLVLNILLFAWEPLFHEAFFIPLPPIAFAFLYLLFSELHFRWERYCIRAMIFQDELFVSYNSRDISAISDLIDKTGELPAIINNMLVKLLFITLIIGTIFDGFLLIPILLYALWEGFRKAQWIGLQKVVDELEVMREALEAQEKQEEQNASDTQEDVNVL